MRRRTPPGLVSYVVIFHPDDKLALWTAVFLLPTVIYGTHLHRRVGRPKSGPQPQGT